MRRLQRQGIWVDAAEYRDAIKRRLIGSGVPEKDAEDGSWRAVLEKYPPQDVEQSENPEEEVGLAALAARSGSSEEDLPRDILWAYGHLENTLVKPEEAPSTGAWGVLKWARQYRNRFFEHLLPKALIVKDKQEAQGASVFDRDMGLDEIRRLLEQVKCAKKEVSRERVKHSQGGGEQNRQAGTGLRPR